MKSTTQGYSKWIALAGFLLLAGFVVSILMALCSGDWRWFIGAAICWFIFAR